MAGSVANIRPDVPLTKLYHMRYTKRMEWPEIARALDCDPKHADAFRKRVERLTKLLPNPEQFEVYQQHKATLFNQVAMVHALNSVRPDALKKSSSNNSAYAAQNFNNMARLEQGESTANVALLGLVTGLSDLDQEIATLQGKLEQLEPVDNCANNNALPHESK